MSAQISGGLHLINPYEVLNRIRIMPGMHVADLGCGGAGHFSIPAATMVGSGGLMYSVDIMKTVLTSVENRASLEGVSNIITVWSNLEKYGATKIPEETLDFAFLINILFQTTDKQTVVKEAMRLVKPHGKLLIVDWNDEKYPFGPSLEKRVNKQEISNFVISLGLEKIDEFEAGKYHYAVLFQKK